jgi:hypothetical protein
MLMRWDVSFYSDGEGLVVGCGVVHPGERHDLTTPLLQDVLCHYEFHYRRLINIVKVLRYNRCLYSPDMLFG